jgi:hypothetical protein
MIGRTSPAPSGRGNLGVSQIAPVAQGEKAFQQSQTDRRRLVGIQQSKLRRHRDAIHY